MFDNFMIQFENFFVSHAYTVFAATAFIIAAILFAFAVGAFLRFVLSKRIDKSIVDTTVRATRITIIILSVISILGEFDINITSLIAGLGIFGFALAIGMRPITTNFFTGLVLKGISPFEEGDYINAERVTGTVESTNLFHTVIVTDDGTYVSVPNGPLWARSIKNLSRPRPRRVDFDITVGRQLEIQELRPAVEKILRSDSARDNAIEPRITIKDVNDSRTVIQAASWYAPDRYWEARERLSKAIGTELAALGAKNVKVAARPRVVRKKAVKKPAAIPKAGNDDIF